MEINAECWLLRCFKIWKLFENLFCGYSNYYKIQLKIIIIIEE